MIKSYGFQYGKGILNIKLDEDNVTGVLLPKDNKPVDISKEMSNIFDHPCHSKPFNEIFKKGDDAVIISSDITRAWSKTSLYLPYIVERLNKAGIDDKNITILSSNGTHRSQTQEELKTVVGEEILKRIKIVEHNCDKETFYVGTTSRGTKVEVSKLIRNKKIILTGGIVHHLMAGFGGGRKSILPGISGRETIRQNHLLALDPANPRSNPLIGVGRIKDNPLNLDMIEAASFVKPAFLVNSIVDGKGNIVKLVGGDFVSAWEQGCAWADDNFGVPIKEKADIVIAGCGGYPKDISLFQATKSLFNGCMALKDGGTLLMIAECREGAGADAFFSWIEPLKAGVLDSELRNNFTIAGYVFYAVIEKAKNIHVVLLTSMDPRKVEPMCIKAVNSLNDALDICGLDGDYKDKKIILMPYAGFTVPLTT